MNPFRHLILKCFVHVLKTIICRLLVSFFKKENKVKPMVNKPNSRGYTIFIIDVCTKPSLTQNFPSTTARACPVATLLTAASFTLPPTLILLHALTITHISSTLSPPPPYTLKLTTLVNNQ